MKDYNDIDGLVETNDFQKRHELWDELWLDILENLSVTEIEDIMGEILTDVGNYQSANWR